MWNAVKKQNTYTSRKQKTNMFASENNIESMKILEFKRRKSFGIH